ncbi:MAG: signal peptidase I [Eubacteriales bacterium]|jgi:signal peptidase I|nr:signal peptidase I [Eubacteriales bacterium]
MRHSIRSTPDDVTTEYWAYEQAPRKRRSGTVSKALLRGCVTALLLIALALLYLRQYTVAGASMAPTLMAGDRVFYVGFTKANYGDLVLFDAGETYGFVIKRVVGLPGDIIEVMQDGRVLRNGVLLDEAYIITDSLGNSALQAVTIESGRLFVLGDNRAESIDSRDVRVGQIRLASVRGVVTRMLRETGPS